MTYRRAAIPAVVGGLLLTALLWWAGASESALRLQGSTDVLGAQAAADLERWLAPWSYDPPASSQLGAAVGGVGDTFQSDSSRYGSLYSTALQIRFAAVLAFFVPGALLLVRRLPPVRGRLTAALLAVWAWGVVAGTLAVTVSAPWLIASQGHGSYRFLPQLAGVISSGRQVLVATALVAAVATVLVARVTAQGAGPLPREVAPARAARLAATAGTAVIALSLVVLSHQSVAATLQTAFSGGGLLSEPGDLLRQWLLLGAWSGPAGTPLGDWLLYRALDVVLLAVVWWSLRLLPGLLTRAGVPALAVGAVCATVLGLLTSQFLRMLVDGTQLRWDLTVAAGFGDGIPAALTWGLVAGVTTALTLRVAVARTRTTDPS
ncbi:hypothetical protein PV733_42565 [Streptomyces europaeiscabiei]|uniref:Integral membrane protein n=1 Tax=Streptomyces europaeiscabiei TaxID=146819 RepID=A0ABU4NT85_9ACTN|nr:hypothetical protein [Streptomyces europaeiscabiei]MDX3548410.1 hypothetical protein [Streptomyces europaeiscabiei]MDX3552604.1 hypothetical protein [Streptomyces europaeiscabiei]MDX3705941.1 hypothetical protein [Streptomyces europaeiscabiei]MDX3715492.1 hypothetical protein [Streptomyces europaeiscabiei]